MSATRSLPLPCLLCPLFQFAILSWDQHGANHGFTFKPIEEDPQKIIASLKQGSRSPARLCRGLHLTLFQFLDISIPPLVLLLALQTETPLGESESERRESKRLSTSLHSLSRYLSQARTRSTHAFKAIMRALHTPSKQA